MRRPAPQSVLALAGALVIAVGLVFLITRSSSSAGVEIQGDVDCDAGVDSVDALQVLRSVAQLPATAECLAAAGDTDCDDEIDSVDSLRILRYVAQMAVLVVAGCVVIGDPLEGTPTLTPTPTPTPTATPTPSPGATGTMSPTPSQTATGEPTPTATVPTGGYKLAGSSIDTSWNDILDFALIPGASGEAAVIRQVGEVWKVSLNGSPPAFMGDLSGPVRSSGAEQGLLSLAFSPDFENDRRLYVYYTADAETCAPGVTRCHHLSRFTVNSSTLDTGSEVVVLEIPVPLAAFNHNGGSLRFGQDGKLYLSVGDGGGGGDLLETGQDNTDLLGSVLRLDVTGQNTYAVPPGNPFADGGDPGNDLVWAYGLRNPWRMSIDSLNGEIWLGDVGQNLWEEVDKVTLGGNYGWRCYEGFAEYNQDGCTGNPNDYVFPRAAYPNQNTDNQAVAGGYVYRGSAMPELYGHYVYADSYSGRIWAVNTEGANPPVELMNTDEFIYSFAELPDGELLVLTGDGIFRLSHA